MVFKILIVISVLWVFMSLVVGNILIYLTNKRGIVASRKSVIMLIDFLAIAYLIAMFLIKKGWL